MITSITILLGLYFARRKLRANAAAKQEKVDDKAPELTAQAG